MNIDWDAVVSVVLWIALAGFTAILWTLAYVACRWIVVMT